MVVIYASSQSDFTAATSEEVARGLSLHDARALVRERLGVAALRRERAWHRPGDAITEGWCESLEPECDSGYFLVAD
jgi:hypothetical protein